MNDPKVQPEDYVQFLLGSPVQFTCTEAARVQPEQAHPPAHDSFNRLLTGLEPGRDNPAQAPPPAHDSFNRLLTGLEPDPETLWLEASPQIRRDDGILVLDDSTLDKPYARKMDLVAWHWSGKHHALVKG